MLDGTSTRSRRLTPVAKCPNARVVFVGSFDVLRFSSNEQRGPVGGGR